MSIEPWALTTSSQDAVALYYAWAAKNYRLFDKNAAMCNWFPLRVLVEFAAAHGVRLRLDYWPGQAPTKGKRWWDTSRKLIHDSHDGKFASKQEYLKKVQGTVTARMIGSLNSVAIESTAARAGDLVCHDLSDRYWHVELITSTNRGTLRTESGSVPAVAPQDHASAYRSMSGTSVYEDKPRRWEFEEVFG